MRSALLSVEMSMETGRNCIMSVASGRHARAVSAPALAPETFGLSVSILTGGAAEAAQDQAGPRGATVAS